MKAILNAEFNFTLIPEANLTTGIDNIDEDDLITFSKGEEVEILKVVNHESWISKCAYVVYSPQSGESITLDSMFVDIIE